MRINMYVFNVDSNNLDIKYFFDYLLHIYIFFSSLSANYINLFDIKYYDINPKFGFVHTF